MSATTVPAPSSSPSVRTPYATVPIEQTGWPKGIPFIVGNEGCERFSFYGMKAILWVYMSGMFVQQLGMDKAGGELLATQRVHLFNAGVYAFPMIGAIIADRLFGKYNTIFWVSLIYCAGHAVLSVSDFAPGLVGGQEMGLYLGLALIAIGSGGIKPCVSANVGDQFGAKNAHLVTKVYQIFYFTINFGSFAATLIIPWLLSVYGPAVAFGVPGVLMFLATVVFFLGRKRFVHVPAKPGGKLGLLDALGAISLFFAFLGSPLFLPASAGVKVVVSLACLAVFGLVFWLRTQIEWGTGFVSVVLYSLTRGRERKQGEGFFAPARHRFGDEAAEGPPAVMRIAGVFAMVSVFWALFDQHASSWVSQAAQMNLMVFAHVPQWLQFTLGPIHLGSELTLLPSQLSALNPLMVMMIIPALNFGLYRPLEKRGIRISPLRRMTAGMFVAAFAFVSVALLQNRIDAAALAGAKIDVMWQALPYLIMTAAEVLVSVTGLEFGYTQAPRSMKSTIMGFWLLTVTFGNLLVAFLAGFSKLSLANFFWVFAGLMGVAAVIFMIIAYFYKYRTYLQTEPDAPATASQAQ